METLMGLALSTIITFGVLTALNNHQKATITAQRNLEFQDTINILAMYVAHTDTCKRLFSKNKINYPIQNIDKPKLLTSESLISFNSLDFDGSSIAEKGVIKNGLKPTMIGLTKMYKAFTDTKNNFYAADFTFAVEKIGESTGATTKEKSFLLYFKTGLDGSIQSCATVDSSEEGKCILSGKVFDFTSVPFCK